jgi:hypothetical protein
MPLAVLRREPPAGRKGEESDGEGVLGFVAYFDDAEAHRWADRLPAPPQYVLANRPPDPLWRATGTTQ